MNFCEDLFLELTCSVESHPPKFVCTLTCTQSRLLHFEDSAQELTSMFASCTMTSSKVSQHRATNVTVTPCLVTADHTLDNHQVLTSFVTDRSPGLHCFAQKNKTKRRQRIMPTSCSAIPHWLLQDFHLRLHSGEAITRA